jgi:hypothetical protein
MTRHGMGMGLRMRGGGLLRLLLVVCSGRAWATQLGGGQALTCGQDRYRQIQEVTGSQGYRCDR